MNRRSFLTTATVSGLSLAAPSYLSAAGEKLRVAVIGHTGRGSFGHGLDTMWLDMPEFEVVAFSDPEEKSHDAQQKKLKGARAFTSYQTMLQEVKPDIVSIGPRHIDQHLEMTLAACSVGAKGVYMEKPFCRSLEEADTILAAATKSGTKIALAHRNRYHPVLSVVQDMVAKGEIGRLLEMRARGKEDARGGSLDLWVLGSHLFNLMHFFGGAPISASATVLQAGKPLVRADVGEGAEGIGPLGGNEVHARFMMSSGVPAYFDSVQNAGTKKAGFGLQLIGTEGIIDLRIDVEPLAHLLPGNPFHMTATPRAWIPISTAGVGKPEPIPNLGKEVSTHHTAARDLVAAIRENREPLCSGQSGRMTVEMISSVFESHRLNGQIVAFPLTTKVNPLTLL